MSNAYWVDSFNLDPAHPEASLTSSLTQFERLGHPGKYTSVIKHTSGETHLTGSNYGYGAALMIGSGSYAAYSKTDKLSLSGGGTILLRDLGTFDTAVGLRNSAILDISVSYISSSATSGAPDVYLFKRQQ